MQAEGANIQKELNPLANAQIQFEADLEQAKKTLEVANISVQEYKEGTYLQDRDQLTGDMTLAASELSRAIGRYEWSKSMAEKKYVSQSQVISDKLTELKANISKGQAERKMNVLEKYTYPKQMTSLQAEVEKSKSDMYAKEATYELEKSKLEKLRKQG